MTLTLTLATVMVLVSACHCAATYIRHDTKHVIQTYRNLHMEKSSFQNFCNKQIHRHQEDVPARYRRDASSRNSTLYANLSLINWNIEGIKYQLDDPDKLFQDADLVMLTETLNLGRPPSLQGYSCLASPARQAAKYGRPTGGIAVYAKPHLNLHLLHSHDNRLHVDTIFGGILVYYFHPSRSIGDMIGEMCTDMRHHRDVALIAGDFNTRLETNDTKSQTLLAFMDTIGFRLVNDPSVATFRMNTKSGDAARSGNSVIDLVFLKEGKFEKHSFDVLRTPSRKHQRVLVHTRLAVRDKDVYELHRKIGKINEDRERTPEVEVSGKSKSREEKKKVGWMARLKAMWGKVVGR